MKWTGLNDLREKYLSFAYARMRGGFTNGTL